MRLLFYIFHFFWRIYDRFSIRDFDYWAFSTHHLHSNLFIENQRAIFDYVSKNREIKKIIFYRGDEQNFIIDDAVNYEILKFGSLRSFFILSKCKVVFLSSSFAMEYSIRWGKKRFSIVKPYLKNRIIINMGHGISIKKILTATANKNLANHYDRVKFRKKERFFYTGILSSSDIDKCVMASMYYPASYQQVWVTGMPRSDFLLMEENKLPVYIKNDIVRIRNIVKKRKLIVYMPTYREVNKIKESYYYNFTKEQIENLKEALEFSNSILAYRPHYFKDDKQRSNLDKYIDGSLIIDFSNNIINDVTSLIREGDVIITDYSSVLADAIYINKPIVGFCYDEKIYSTYQNGLIYSLDLLYGKYLYSDFSEIIKLIEKNEDYFYGENYKNIRKILYQYIDTDNCKRVIKNINHLLK